MAKCAQINPTTIRASVENRIICDVRGVRSSTAARTSFAKAKSVCCIGFHCWRFELDRLGRALGIRLRRGLERRKNCFARTVRDEFAALENQNAVDQRKQRG